MNLKENDQIPNSEVFIFENNAPVKKNLHDLLKGKKVVLFGLPGAYTSVCSAKHLPGYVFFYTFKIIFNNIIIFFFTQNILKFFW